MIGFGIGTRENNPLIEDDDAGMDERRLTVERSDDCGSGDRRRGTDVGSIDDIAVGTSDDDKGWVVASSEPAWEEENLEVVIDGR